MARVLDSTDNGLDLPSFQWAAQFNPTTRRAEINQVPIPSIKPDEILVKVRAASLCHSDLMLFEDNEQGLILGEGTPFTMGHEACGTILRMGSKVGANFQIGDKIGWLPIVDCCFDCEGCQLSNLRCERGTPKIQGMKVDGFFQPYCAINWRNAAKIPEGMQLDSLAPMFCAGCTAFNAVNDTIKALTTEPSKTYVAVIGCGGLGHLGIQYLKAYGYIVIGVDISSEALNEAVAQEADHVFNSLTDKNYVERITAITGGGGCHAAINFTNSAASYAAMPDLLRTNGLLMVAGIPQKPLTFNAFDITMNRYQIRGSNNGITSKLAKCLEFSQRHGIIPNVTQFKLEQFQEMLDLMQSNKHKGRLGVLFD